MVSLLAEVPQKKVEDVHKKKPFLSRYRKKIIKIMGSFLVDIGWVTLIFSESTTLGILGGASMLVCGGILLVLME